MTNDKSDGAQTAKNGARPHFAFFGTPEFSALILDELEQAGYMPSLVVTGQDKPAGRKLILTPPPVKIWAEARGIPVLQPKSLKGEELARELASRAPDGRWDVFALASYGKIVPKSVLDIPKRGILNVHPSLLPKLRGASPIQSAILSGEKTGVTIMLLDEEMDHGPIVAQKEIAAQNDVPRYENLETELAREGGRLLAEILEPWVEGKIEGREQNHAEATFCKKIAKEDGLLDFAADPLANLRKIRAFSRWPGTYFFADKNGGKIRVVVKGAEISDGALRITRVIPEGKKEMDYADFTRSLEI